MGLAALPGALACGSGAAAALPQRADRPLAMLHRTADIPFNYCGNPLLHTGAMYGEQRAAGSGAGLGCSRAGFRSRPAGPPAPCRLPPPTAAGFWRDWDGSPFNQVPLFYHGLTDLAGQTLEGMWGELRATSEALAAALGLAEPPSALRRIHSVVLERYAAVVGDPSTMLTSLRTNGAYAYTVHPASGGRGSTAGCGWAVRGARSAGADSVLSWPSPALPPDLRQMVKDPASGRLVPNFRARYLTEGEVAPRAAGPPVVLRLPSRSSPPPLPAPCRRHPLRPVRHPRRGRDLRGAHPHHRQVSLGGRGCRLRR